MIEFRDFLFFNVIFMLFLLKFEFLISLRNEEIILVSLERVK